jgi:hypothetical protein
MSGCDMMVYNLPDTTRRRVAATMIGTEDGKDKKTGIPSRHKRVILAQGPC